MKTVAPSTTADINLTVVLKFIQDLTETGRKSGADRKRPIRSTTELLYLNEVESWAVYVRRFGKRYPATGVSAEELSGPVVFPDSGSNPLYLVQVCRLRPTKPIFQSPVPA